MPDTTINRAARSSAQPVRSIRQWTPRLWSLRTDKPEGFRFQPGHYAKLGLPAGEPAVWRPYSIVSTPADDALEFLLILIPDGAFSHLLAEMGEGRQVRIDAAAFGFFTVSQLAPGDTLWMLATGTGLGPYVSLLRTPGALDAFGRVVLVHSVRLAAELAYRDEIRALADASGGRITYLPVVTRETGATPLRGRLPQLIADGSLQQAAGATLDPASGRVMVCGNPDFTTAMRELLAGRGFLPCRRGIEGSMLFEKYW